ncbi:hypothetical protein [Vibrio panuliri]|nr:hypothetical protein [Vibrio panuliri]
MDKLVKQATLLYVLFLLVALAACAHKIHDALTVPHYAVELTK